MILIITEIFVPSFTIGYQPLIQSFDMVKKNNVVAVVSIIVSVKRSPWIDSEMRRSLLQTHASRL